MTCPHLINAVTRGDTRKTQAARRRGRSLSVCAAAGLLLAAMPVHRAVAADWPGNPPPVSSSGNGTMRWDGINFGAQLGLTSIDTDFGNSTGQEVAYILRNTTLQSEIAPSGWTTLPHNVSNGRTYGAFLGYNMQWDQLVLGVDAAYNRTTSLQSSESDVISRQVTPSDNVTHVVTIWADATNRLIDYATLRGRAGYAIGQFLPYAFGGAAVGRFNYTSSATVKDVWTPSGGTAVTFGPLTQSDAKDNAVVGGFTLGLGMDVALLPNVFLRAEWEYVGFAPTNGIRSGINTGRVGVGARF